MHLAADRPEQVEKLVLLASVSTRGYPFYGTDEKGQPTGRRLSTRAEIAGDPGKTLPILRALRQRDKQFLRNLWEMLIYTHRRPDPDRYEAYLEDILTQRNLVDVYHALNTFNISDRHNGLVDGTGEAERIVAPTLVLWGIATGWCRRGWPWRLWRTSDRAPGRWVWSTAAILRWWTIRSNCWAG